MTAAAFTPSDPATGEVLSDAAARAVASSIAEEYVAVQEAYDEAVQEVRRLDERRQELRAALTRLVPVEGRADGGRAWVAVTPGRPGRRSVSAQACEAYREELLGLGLGRVEQVFRPPTIAQVDAARGELTASGVPVSVIAPPPEQGAPTLSIVAKGQRS